jgi:hypothetical protein
MSGRSWVRQGTLISLLALGALLPSACGDDDDDSAPGTGGDDGQAGMDAIGGVDATAGGRASGGAAAGDSSSADAGELGTSFGGVGGSASGGAGGTQQGDSAGSGGEAATPCTGELVGGECVAPFSRVQGATRTAGTAATTDTVKVVADTTAGNTLLLGVGLVWNGVAQTITVPDGFTLIERKDNTTGTTTHESAALYIAESAPVLPAATGVTVTVADAQARLFLLLVEYAGLRASGVVDRISSAAGSGAPTTGTTAATTANAELWVALTMSRGGGGHSAPTDGFTMTDEKTTGAGTFSLLEKLVDVSGPATASLTGSGDYASVLATLKR